MVLALLVNHSALRDDRTGRAEADRSATHSPTGSSGGTAGDTGRSAGPSGTALPGTREAPQLSPTEVPAPPRTPEADQYCPGFIAALPITLDGLPARPAHSDSPYVGTWGDPAVTFRCGVPRPADLTPTSNLLVINGVQWLTRENGDTTVFVVVDRLVYVELTVPKRYAGGPLTGVATAVAKTLPARPVRVR